MVAVPAESTPVPLFATVSVAMAALPPAETEMPLVAQSWMTR